MLKNGCNMIPHFNVKKLNYQEGDAFLAETYRIGVSAFDDRWEAILFRVAKLRTDGKTNDEIKAAVMDWFENQLEGTGRVGRYFAILITKSIVDQALDLPSVELIEDPE